MKKWWAISRRLVVGKINGLQWMNNLIHMSKDPGIYKVEKEDVADTELDEEIAQDRTREEVPEI